MRYGSSIRPIPSGVPDLDEVMGGLLPGDNVVWVSTDPDLSYLVEKLMLAARTAAEPAIYVTARQDPGEIRTRVGDGVAVLDARPGTSLSDPALLEHTLVAEVKDGATRVVVDDLVTLARRWRTERATGFFKRVCPRLFDLGAIAYWRVSRAAMGTAAIEDIQKVTQCVFELTDNHLRIVKAEGRPPSVQGRLFRLSRAKDGIELEAERALGRLADSLRRIRSERNLTQAELARLSGVSASAISQAEAGQRGLSLDTLLTLTNRLGTGLDNLLENQQRPEYVLARRDRGRDLGDSRFLLDDPSAGMRVYLVNLQPGEQGTPPVTHKGPELVLVARGLVLVDLGSSSPAMRAGDAILARKVPVLAWHNLAPEPSVLFWILRD